MKGAKLETVTIPHGFATAAVTSNCFAVIGGDNRDGPGASEGCASPPVLDVHALTNTPTTHTATTPARSVPALTAETQTATCQPQPQHRHPCTR